MSMSYIDHARAECLNCPNWKANEGCQIQSGLQCPIKNSIQMSYYDWIHIKHHLTFYGAKKGPIKRFITKIDKLGDIR
jgi:hypothetical protein